MEIEKEMVADYECRCGENPLWHPMEKRVYWTDITTGRLFRFDPSTGEHEKFYEGDVVGGFTVQKNGDLLLFMDRGAVKVWREGELIPVIDEVPEERDSRFNDVIADPEGRVFCGTMSTPGRAGSLYRLDRDGTLTKILGEVGCSNGMGFVPGLGRMYHTDSNVQEIMIYDYDRSTGELSSGELFLKLPEEGGNPDGMTVDSEGYVWSAIWDGGRLARYSPVGEEVLSIPFPARKVSSAIFGGEGLEEIYVTTAGGEKKEVEGQGAGGLFRLRTGHTGVPEFFSRIGI
ncbi:MAG: SMP-30/gluconolactonase/LRE family protein [Theionarchaea archaeon]|nr:SMP-30/gluconolactonase/LRE family protein [Theionarchaea archaeon]